MLFSPKGLLFLSFPLFHISSYSNLIVLLYITYILLIPYFRSEKRTIGYFGKGAEL